MKYALVAAAATAVLATAAATGAHIPEPEPSIGTPMDLVMMEDKVAQGAVCLDGTAAGFYFSKATKPEDANKWELYFEGGGWCYSEMDCWGRSKTNLGSSTHWPKTMSAGGIMSDNSTVSPTFATWNRVFFVYCDGNSFSGNRDLPVTVMGKPLFFRGRRIIDAIFQTLYDKYGLASATHVLQTGCSAGGLATYLHADYVGELLRAGAKGLQVYKAASISGFFRLANNVMGAPVYPDEMRTIFELANSTNGVNAACIEAMPAEEQWKCNFAQMSYQHIQTPFMVLNSAYDSWQSGCIFTSEPVPANSTDNGHCGAVPNWSDCSKNPELCTNAQMPQVDAYESGFVKDMQSAAAFTKAGNGAFVHSCHTHCEAQSTPAYMGFSVGGVTMQQAVEKWWASPVTTPAAANTHLPCLYHATSTPRQCNPSCSL